MTTAGTPPVRRAPLQICTVGWSLPDDWRGWAHGNLQNARGMSADERLAAAAIEQIIDSDFPGTSHAAMWLPEGANGVSFATAVIRQFYADPVNGPRLDWILERTRANIPVPRGVRVLDVAAQRASVPAGEAVLQIVDTAPRFRRRVTREWSWFILPPQTDDFVMLHVDSTFVSHFDEIANMTTAIASAIEITLEPA